jgi:DNA uptake protein ComE-like DNA-binding protein
LCLSASRSERKVRCVLLVAFAVLVPVGAAYGDVNDGLDEVDETEVLEALESLGDESAVDDALSDLMREAAALRANRLDVNSASVAELLRVPFLDIQSAVCIVGRRAAGRRASSLDDLVSSGCLSPSQLERVRPYLVASDNDAAHGTAPDAAVASPPAPVVGSGAQAEPDGERRLTWEARIRITGGGEPDTSWDGNSPFGRMGSLGRLRLRYGDTVAFSIACDKDAGEREILDHVGCTATWTGDGVTAGAGDFVGSWGQGLLLGRGGFPATAGYPRTREGLRAYDGAGEGSARRGVFATVSRGPARFQSFVAQSRLDATLTDSGRVSTVRSSGMHRTSSEVNGADALSEFLVGLRGTVSWTSGLDVSASALQARYSPGLELGDDERKRFGFRGSEIRLIGADALFRTGDIAAGCELVAASSAGVAAVAGMRLKRGDVRARAGGGYLSKDFWSPLGGGVPGFSGGSNGAVAWLGIEYRPDDRLRVETEVRVTGRPWRSYLLELPDRSTSVRLGGSIGLGSLGRLEAEFVNRVGTAEIGESNTTADRTTRRMKLSLRARGPAPVALTVARATKALGEIEEGALLAIGASIGGTAGPDLTYSAGLTSTTARGSPPATVQYQPGLPGEFSLRSLNTSGTRWYIQVRSRLGRLAGITIRIAGGPNIGGTTFGVAIDAGG